MEVGFQSAFRLEIHQNNIFFNLFLTSAHQKDKKTVRKII
jgi:hypothetical protein